MTWQFWITLAAFVISLAYAIRREREHRRRFSEYIAHIDWLQEQHKKNTNIASREFRKERAYGNQRHFFGIVEGLGIARKDAWRFLRRDW